MATCTTLASATRLVVVQGVDAARLTSTLDALRSRTSLPVEVVMMPAGDDRTFEATLSRTGHDTVLVALGPRASDFVGRLPRAGPAVHCLAGPDALRAGLPGVPSEAPFDQQAQWLGRLVPLARTVAVLFDPAINARRAQALDAAFTDAGYRLMLQPVASPAALPSALDAIAGRADVLLALPDATVYTRESTRGILLFSFRNRMPVIGPNDAWVRKGALYTLDWDYAEVGAACAVLAERELRPAGGAQPAPLLRPRVAVNVRTASHFGLAWDRDTLRGVHQRYE